MPSFPYYLLYFGGKSPSNFFHPRLPSRVSYFLFLTKKKWPTLGGSKLPAPASLGVGRIQTVAVRYYLKI
jgi:hypothetical protein